MLRGLLFGLTLAWATGRGAGLRLQPMDPGFSARSGEIHASADPPHPAPPAAEAEAESEGDRAVRLLAQAYCVFATVVFVVGAIYLFFDERKISQRLQEAQAKAPKQITQRERRAERKRQRQQKKRPRK